jgi:hypothetical protein
MGEENSKKKNSIKSSWNHLLIPKLVILMEWQSFEGLSMSSSDLLGTMSMRQDFPSTKVFIELKPITETGS